MKPKLLSLGGLILLLTSCATEPAALKKIDQSGLLQHRFQVRSDFSLIGKEYFRSNGDVMGTIRFESETQRVFWDDEELLLLDEEEGKLFPARYFYSKKRQIVISIGRPMVKSEKHTAVMLNNRWWITGSDIQYAGKTNQELFAMVMGLRIKPNTTDLFAISKCVDGQTIEFSRITHAGKLTVNQGDVTLSGRIAVVQLVAEASGSRFLVITSGESTLMLYPNGGWYMFAGAEFSLGLLGVSSRLSDTYLALRARAMASSSKELPMVPESVRKRLNRF